MLRPKRAVRIRRICLWCRDELVRPGGDGRRPLIGTVCGRDATVQLTRRRQGCKSRASVKGGGRAWGAASEKSMPTNRAPAPATNHSPRVLPDWSDRTYSDVETESIWENRRDGGGGGRARGRGRGARW